METLTESECLVGETPFLFDNPSAYYRPGVIGHSIISKDCLWSRLDGVGAFLHTFNNRIASFLR